MEHKERIDLIKSKLITKADEFVEIYPHLKETAESFKKKCFVILDEIDCETPKEKVKKAFLEAKDLINVEINNLIMDG